MKKEITKEQVRIALCYLVGWLTENSIHRRVMGMREILSDFPENDMYAAMQTFRAMLTKGWARLNGCNARAIYTSSCTTPKLNGESAIDAAAEELMPFIDALKVKKKVDAQVREDIVDLMPEGVTEKSDENCEKPFSIPWDAIRGLVKSSPEILVMMLREEGWKVTATKEITITKEL